MIYNGGIFSRGTKQTMSLMTWLCFFLRKRGYKHIEHNGETFGIQWEIHGILTACEWDVAESFNWWVAGP